MIFLDANVFLRFLTNSTDPKVERMRRITLALFGAIERGDEEATTSEVVIHEVCFVLGSKAHYGLSPAAITESVSPLIKLPGMKLGKGEKETYLRAFEIFVANPKLEYSDSIIVARCEASRLPLATFDKRLANLPGLVHWEASRLRLDAADRMIRDYGDK